VDNITVNTGNALDHVKDHEDGETLSSIDRNEKSMDLDVYSNELEVKVKSETEEDLNLNDEQKIVKESTTNSSTNLTDNLSTAAEGKQIEWEEIASSIVVTTKKYLKTAPVRYSVELTCVRGEHQIPYYSLFSTCTIPTESFICSTFGTLSDLAHLNPSLLPCRIANDTFTLPPFTLKVFQNRNWILDCRTRGDISGRYIRRSCSESSANAIINCMIVKDEAILNKKLVFGIFSTKEISVGEEIVLSTPGCHSFPCACDFESKCTAKDHFANISQEYATSGRPSLVKQVNKSNKKTLAKKKLPMFLRILVLSHQKKIKALKAQKIQEPPGLVSVSTEYQSIQFPKEPTMPHSRAASSSAPRRKPHPSPVIESPKPLSREERKLKEQLALFEKMEQQDKKKRKRRTNGDPSAEISPTLKNDFEESEEDVYTGSSSKVDNETSESIGRDSPASATDLAEKHEDEPEYKRKFESVSASESLIFKKPKLENSEKISITPAPLVRKLSLKDFLQKRNQNKTPSPSSQLSPAENP
jgi:hypothetical protein